MILLISYDLKQPDRNYESLYDTIKQCGTKWWHYLESVWLIKTDLTPQLCFERLHRKIDENDYLFIVDISRKSHEGWLPKSAWEWIKDNDE